MARVKRVARPTTVQIAKVPHTCSICGRKVQPGEQYRRRVRDVYNGEYRYIKTCTDHYTPQPLEEIAR